MPAPEAGLTGRRDGRTRRARPTARSTHPACASRSGPSPGRWAITHRQARLTAACGGASSGPRHRWRSAPGRPPRGRFESRREGAAMQCIQLGLFALALVMGALAVARAAEGRGESTGAAIAGTYWVSVQGAAAGTVPIPAVLAFTADGRIIGVEAQGPETASLGTWEAR